MTQTPADLDLNTLTSLCKRRGFLYQSSEIYGGMGSTWDYGPLGAELKRNVKSAWWRSMVWGRDDMVGLDSAVLMHPEVWRASGHVDSFRDPLVECKSCHERFRPEDVVVWEHYGTRGSEKRLLGRISEFNPKAGSPSKETEARMTALTLKHGYKWELDEPTWRPFSDYLENPGEIECPFCHSTGNFTEARQFDLMFKTFVGPVEDDSSVAYLRPETAQGIFVNFGNVLTSTRRKLPFGIAQIGKAFRNEITTGNFIFRTREFEIMELEYFVAPGQAEEWHQRWFQESFDWYTGLGVDACRLKKREHDSDELAHYSKATHDIEYLYPWGWGEVAGVANRADYDLQAHSKHSGQDLSYFDEETKQHFTPHVVEPTFGVDRSVLTFLVDAYTEEEAPTAGGKVEKRVLLKLHPALAPVKVAVLPLSRNERLTPLAHQVHDRVRSSGAIDGLVQYDDAQSIGRRYRRQDEIGTPLCVTVDFDSLDDNAVTIRERDSMAQVRVPIADLVGELLQRLAP